VADIPNTADTEADMLAQYEDLERRVSKINDTARQRRHILNWMAVLLAVAAVACLLAYPDGLKFLSGLLFVLVLVLLMEIPVAAETARTYQQVTDGREMFDTSLASNAELNTLRAALALSQMEAAVGKLEDTARIIPKPRTGGRPRNEQDDWAWEQVNTLKRDRGVVFEEWKGMIELRLKALDDPKNSFSQAINPKRGPKNRE
jgi:hypothetical protein